MAELDFARWIEMEGAEQTFSKYCQCLTVYGLYPKPNITGNILQNQAVWNNLDAEFGT